MINRSDNGARATLTNVAFSGNSAAAGGGMVNDGENGGVSSPALSGVTFSGNRAVAYGGGMFNLACSSYPAPPRSTDDVPWGNRAPRTGLISNVNASFTLSCRCRAAVDRRCVRRHARCGPALRGAYRRQEASLFTTGDYRLQFVSRHRRPTTPSASLSTPTWTATERQPHRGTWAPRRPLSRCNIRTAGQGGVAAVDPQQALLRHGGHAHGAAGPGWALAGRKRRPRRDGQPRHAGHHREQDHRHVHPDLFAAHRHGGPGRR